MACAGNSGQRCGAAGRLAVRSRSLFVYRYPYLVVCQQVYKKGGGSSTSAPAPTPNTSKYIRPTDSDHAFAAPGRDGWYPVGCFKDPVAPRALRGESWLNQGTMTPKSCATHCANLGFNYAGVEVSRHVQFKRMTLTRCTVWQGVSLWQRVVRQFQGCGEPVQHQVYAKGSRHDLRARC